MIEKLKLNDDREIGLLWKIKRLFRGYKKEKEIS
jgi:hypothetical protein